jgi:hypothetical protein
VTGAGDDIVLAGDGDDVVRPVMAATSCLGDLGAVQIFVRGRQLGPCALVPPLTAIATTRPTPTSVATTSSSRRRQRLDPRRTRIDVITPATATTPGRRRPRLRSLPSEACHHRLPGRRRRHHRDGEGEDWVLAATALT